MEKKSLIPRIFKVHYSKNMAKDPAVLWYWNDWNSGTVLMSRFLKGCYVDLLHAQHNHGRLSLEEIKICLGSDFGQAWPALQKKFKQDATGLFFNERAELEKERRQKFTERQRLNGAKGGRKPMAKPKPNPNPNPDESLLENEDEIEIKDDLGKGGGKGEPSGFNHRPKADDIPDPPEWVIDSFRQQYYATKQKMLQKETIRTHWNGWKLTLTGDKFYNNLNEVYNNFINRGLQITFKDEPGTTGQQSGVAAFKTKLGGLF